MKDVGCKGVQRCIARIVRSLPSWCETQDTEGMSDEKTRSEECYEKSGEIA